MRVIVGPVLLLRAGPQLWSAPTLPTTLASASLAGSGLLLVAGLWTPLAGAAVAVIELFGLVRAEGDPVVRLLAAAIAGSLAMLGPGRWSVDARLFGWKRIEVPPRKTSANAL
jgi:uncharacterized membrane protein YphA (DoxX/SURF4 family)